MNLLCVLCLTCNFTIDGLLQVVVPKPRNQPLARFSIWQDSANETVYQQALLDPNRVELEQNLEQLVVQDAVLSLVAFTRRPTLLVFARPVRFVHPAD